MKIALYGLDNSKVLVGDYMPPNRDGSFPTLISWSGRIFRFSERHASNRFSRGAAAVFVEAQVWHLPDGGGDDVPRRWPVLVGGESVAA